jgi:hypothetical protein
LPLVLFAVFVLLSVTVSEGVRAVLLLRLLWFGGCWFRCFAGVAGVSAADWIDHKDEIGDGMGNFRGFG